MTSSPIISIRAIENKDIFLMILTIIARVIVIYMLLFLMTDINIAIQSVILAFIAQLYMMWFIYCFHKQ